MSPLSAYLISASGVYKHYSEVWVPGKRKKGVKGVFCHQRSPIHASPRGDGYVKRDFKFTAAGGLKVCNKSRTGSLKIRLLSLSFLVCPSRHTASVYNGDWHHAIWTNKKIDASFVLNSFLLRRLVPKAPFYQYSVYSKMKNQRKLQDL